MKAFRPLWIAFRAAVLGAAVYWVAINIIDRTGWKGLSISGLNLTEPVVFFVIFFFGVLWVGTG